MVSEQSPKTNNPRTNAAQTVLRHANQHGDVNAERPVVRFAPSPQGYLHIGHAYSALLNYNYAQETGGRFLLRIEDIDGTRFRQEFLDQIYDDLSWLGLSWEVPVRRQSGDFETYRSALVRLAGRLPLYCSGMSRQDIKDHVLSYEAREERGWPRDPDGAPLYPARDRPKTMLQPEELADKHGQAVRLHMDNAVDRLADPLTWTETGSGPDGETGLLTADPSLWGDVVLARKDIDTSYTLAVVVDDALQGISHVIRGQDLFHATSVQRLLQHFLDLPVPVYHHHRLLLDDQGKKLAKSRGSSSIKSLRDEGKTPDDVYALIGLRPA